MNRIRRFLDEDWIDSNIHRQEFELYNETQMKFDMIQKTLIRIN